MRILVTGAAGFIGMHLCAHLLAQGHQVVGCDNLSDLTYDRDLKIALLRHLGLDLPHAADLSAGSTFCHDQFTFVKLDLLDQEGITQLITSAPFAVVVNLAGLAGVRLSTSIPQQYVRTNVNGFLHVLEAIRLCKQQSPELAAPRLLMASSSSVYGDCTEVPFSECNTNIRPKSVYAATKYMDEILAYSYATLYNLDIVALRFFTVYGPYGRPDMAPFIFLKALLEDKEITLFNAGQSRRDFTYVGDIVTGITKIIEQPQPQPAQIPASPPLAQPQAAAVATLPVPFAVYNIGNGQPIELFAFVRTLEEITGMHAKIKLAPMPQGDVTQTYADVSKLERDYHFRPQTSLREGLQAFYEWYCSYYGDGKQQHIV